MKQAYIYKSLNCKVLENKIIKFVRIGLISLMIVIDLKGQKLQLSKLYNPPIFQELLAPNGCNITVNAGPDITICTGVGKQINGMVTGNFDKISWDPTDGLSNPNVANPIANPSNTTTYTLTATGVSANLFVNGGFETGGIAPSSSGYTQYNNVSTFAMSTGGYMVMSVPQIAAQFGCNPPIGLFTLAITPTGPGTNFLCQTIPVTSNTMYKIKFKCFGIPYIFGSPPVVNLKINSTNVGSVAVASGLCDQTDGDFMWNSGAAVSANICFYNSGGTGTFSMFSIDDIEVKECCEVKDEVKVTVYEVIADIAMPDEITCTNSPMTLDGSGSTSGPLIKYEWSTTNGNIVSGDKTNKSVIDKPGTYTLKVIGEYGCEKSTTIKVDGNTTPPEITATNTDLDCKNIFAKIEATSKVNPVTFDWTGPNGYSSSRASNNNIREPGEYEVTVIDDYGCKSTKKVNVKDNRTEVFLDLKGDTLKCGADSIELKASSVSAKPSFIWRLRDSSFVKKANVFVKDTGMYYITVTDSLGCSITDSFRVISYKAGVPISLNSNHINCKNKTVSIQLTADTSGFVSWTGPNGFTSTDKNPIVQDSGWYYINLSTKDGCKGKDSIYVKKDITIPDLKISNSDTITCKKTSIDLVGSTTTINSKITWIGPQGILGNNTTYSVIDSGDYAFIVEADNGCLNSGIIKIYKIQDTPVLNLKNDTLDCLKRSIDLEVGKDSFATYSWTGPNGFVSTQRKITFDKPGTYQVTATSKYGCITKGDITIIENLSSLTTSINPPAKITCINKSVTLNANPISGVKYNWSTSSTQSSITVTTKGTYTVTVSDLNDICSGIAQITVEEDTTSPMISLTNDGPITCKMKDVTLYTTTGNNVSYKWSNGPTTSGSVTNMAGTYTVTITDNNNGCTAIANSAIAIDTLSPVASASNDGPLTCTKNSVILSAGPSSGVTYLWSTGDLSQSATISKADTYTVTITNTSNGCSSVATTTVTTQAIQTNASNNGPITCSNKSVTLTTPAIPNATYKWSTGDLTQNSTATQIGTYTVTITDGTGCSSIATTTVSIDTIKPNATISADDIVCNKQAFLNATNISQGASVIWTGPNGFSSTQTNSTITIAGKYFITVIASNGCTFIDSVISIQKDILPDLSVMDDTLNCLRRTLLLFAESMTNNVRYEWTGPNNFISTQKNPSITEPGTYNIKVIDGNGCEIIKSLSISIDTLGPSLSLSADTLTCLRPTVPIKAGTNIQGFNIQWNGPGGFSSMFPQAIVNKAGIYNCTITNPRTQCKTTRTIEVIEDTNRIRSATIDKQDAACGSISGTIQILNIMGGSPTYQYSIDNGITYSARSLYSNLTPGTYNIKVRDRNGCEYSELISINSVGGVKVDLIPTLDLNVNEQRQLQLTISNSTKNIISWNPSDQLSCNDCSNPTLTAKKNQTITVLVIDENGCRDSAVLVVRVIDDVFVFVPTVFSPNGDEINDYFFPVSNILDLPILNLSVYDRWGNIVFSNSNFPANQGKLGWNGIYKGSPLNPGVYVYSIKYKSGNATKNISGDITLLR